MINFLHTGDFHLSRDEPERLEILRWVLKKAVHLKCEGIFISGDLFDSNKEAFSLYPRVREIFESFPQLNIFLLPGNHDTLAYGEEFHFGKNTYTLTKVPFHRISIGEVEIIGIPFQEKMKVRECLKQADPDPQKSIILLHGTLYDASYSLIYTELEEEAKYMPFYPREVENKALYIALGHFHSSFVRLEWGVYPGSPLSTGRNCVGKRKVAKVTVEGGKVRVEEVVVEPAPFWERPFSFTIFPGKERGGIEEIEETLLSLRAGMVEVRVGGFIEGKVVEFEKELEKLKRKFRKKFFELEFKSSVRPVGRIMEDPLAKRFVEELEKTDHPEKERALELFLEEISGK